MGYAEAAVLLGAAVCVMPVVVGFIVTRWVKYWNRAGREGGVV